MARTGTRQALEERLEGRRVLVTGAARGIGASLARRLYARGARVALLGLERELLEQVATMCGGAPWRVCDVRDGEAVQRAVDALADDLGGRRGGQCRCGGATSPARRRPRRHDAHRRGDLLGTYHTVRAAGPLVAHPGGYVLLVASAAAGVQLPLMGAYAAKQGRGGGARQHVAPRDEAPRLRVGVAYLARSTPT
ncbi:SDR family NAD(P)-dependent oxidoreductase [Rhodococcus hoagii]|nr:SDR family NAD(P)-dependent oxidoreductase [Prescottella equi]